MKVYYHSQLYSLNVMRALNIRKCAIIFGGSLVLFIFGLRSISVAPEMNVEGHKIDDTNKIQKKISSRNDSNLLEERRACYTHDVRHSSDYSAYVEYFPNLNSSFNQPKLNSAIFFIDANCSTSGLLDITPRQACSYESAALNNADTEIYILHLTPVGINTNNKLWPQTYQPLTNYPNLHFVNIRISDLTENPLIQEWITVGEVFEAKHLEQISDLARLLVIYKYGGTYIDSDMIIFDNLNKLGTNWFCVQDEKAISINNAVFKLNNYGIGKLISHQCLEEFRRNFNLKKRAENGPVLLTKILKKICKIDNINAMTDERCGGFRTLPFPTFYAIPWNERRYDHPDAKVDLLNMTSNSFGMHLWNFITKKKKFSLRNDGAMSKFATDNCPLIAQTFTEI